MATAAGRVVLTSLTQSDYDELAARVQRFGANLEAALQSGGLSACVPNVGPLLGLYVAPGGAKITAPTDYASAKALCSNGVYPKLFHALLERQVALAPGAYEILFTSFAHDEVLLDEVCGIAEQAAAQVAAELN